MTSIEAAALIAGDEDAWSAFYADITPKIEQAIMAVLGDSHSEIEVEDLRQDVFLALLENDQAVLKCFAPLPVLDTYICGIARHKAIDALRSV